ncbi:acyl-CoA dehydrogenase family protein [Roseateles sp.]|uniref:acyl-CoA dehydrogenase family protein n=1 Tax=Roseateles sp. TaxID=1971397 RepID=UPI00393A421D
MAYVPPLESMRFAIEQVLQAPLDWQQCPLLASADADLAGEVLLQAGRLATDILAPLNAPGDLQGCRWRPSNQGSVTTPDGFPAAWQRFVEGGWPALACDEADGGQGLPQLLNVALFEMLPAANHGWTMYAGLLHGAYEALRHTATPALRDRYLAEVVSGETLVTMNLTEPAAGSDLALLRCKAEPVTAGNAANGDPVRITGSKIFISGGEHDLTDNILHLVLARLPDAPAGTRGLSLFLVPKTLPDGRRNSVHCDGLEHKMGIHGSSTCQMRFEAAEGWLLGEPGGGLAAMFLMMNSARVLVGLQGLGHLEAATQIAESYAQERRQSRAPGSTGGPDFIAQHPAIRRILLDLRAQAEGARVLAYATGQQLDRAQHAASAAERQEAQTLLAVLTPVVKAYLTQLGHAGADRALGVLGGYGYMHDYGIEQHVRDSRIAMIYEGTNEIQAIDLLVRKMLGKPEHLVALLGLLGAEAEACQAAGLPAWATELTTQATTVRTATEQLRAASPHDPERPYRVADDYLQGVALSLMAWAWARLARAAQASPDSPQRSQRLAWAEHGRRWLLPAAQVHWALVQADPLPLG